jgi:Domain of unknown function (DUF932)
VPFGAGSQLLSLPLPGDLAPAASPDRPSILDFSVVSPQERPDVYGPFVRVSNSYNGLRALSFNIGFYRKVCTNGLIGRDAIIRFRFTHSRREIGTTVLFEVAHEKLKELKSSYKKYFDALRACVVRKEELFPLVVGAFSFRAPEQPNSQNRESKQCAASLARGRRSDFT